ncbi:hypothetical protein [Aeromonas sobria]|uniref:hypothetical protein n=1 Tax=Aeromonas sobria TaxID=646 RepID=UPI003F34489F
MRKTTICMLVAAIIGSAAAIAATESTKTPAVVGFKPFYENKTGKGAFSGKLEVGGEITVDPQALDYQHPYMKAGFPGHEHDLENSEIHWLLDGREVANNVLSFTLPADSAGKKLVVEATPFSQSGDPVRGKRLVIGDLRAAGVEGGDEDGNITAQNTPPSISGLNITGTLEVGKALSGRYTFAHNGGNQSDKSRYQWGKDGSSIGLANAKEVTKQGEVGNYTIVSTDAGSVVELTVQAKNGLSVEGNKETVKAGGGNKVPHIKPSISGLNITGTLEVGKALSGRYTFAHNGGNQSDKSRYQWGKDGSSIGLANAKEVTKQGEVGNYTIVSTDVGTVVELTVQAKNGLSVEGNKETVKAGGGNKVPQIKPSVSGLGIANYWYQPGHTISGYYTFNGNGGSAEGKSLYQWGRQGATSGLGNGQQITESGKIPSYRIQRGDIGQVIEFSIKPVNKDNVSGDVATHGSRKVEDSTPAKVDITYDNPSTAAKNGVDNHPVINKSKMSAKITKKAGADVTDDKDSYYFEWKIGGVIVDKGVGKNTFTATSSTSNNNQGKGVSVNVLPKDGDYMDR